MQGQAGDRRVRRTKQLLLSGLIKLMEEKSLKDISVRELAELIDINRGTFYLHYRDIYDLLEQTEEEIYREFQDMVIEFSPPKMQGQPRPLLIGIFRFIADRADLARVILGKNGDIAFLDRLKIIVKDMCLHNWMYTFSKEKTQYFDYFFSFIASGFIGLFQSWLNGGMRETPEEMGALAEQMIANGIKILA